MSTFRNPVGPQPTKIYWRRRLVVILGLLAVIVIISLIVFRPGNDKPQTAADTKPSSSATPASTEAPAGDDAECAEGVVDVVPITDAGDYGADQQPLLSLSITNTGTTACTFNAGTDAQEYVVTSGEEKIWSSKDCQTEPVANAQVLEPGVALTTTPFPWDRTRSAADTCDSTDRPSVTAGGASYHLEVTINGVTSADTKQFILN
jgi:hypothetical protein